jgi:hypothetical protein
MRRPFRSRSWSQVSRETHFVSAVGRRQADAITKRLSDMTDAELAALEARMITMPAALALEHADKPQADGDDCADDGRADGEAAGD